MSTYLVHHGYSATAEVFAQTTGQPISEDLASIKNRQSTWKCLYLEKKIKKTLIQTLGCQLSSTLMQLLFSFDQDMRVEKTFIQTLTCQLSSTLMQLLFSFDQDMKVEKTLIQTLTYRPSIILVNDLIFFSGIQKLVLAGRIGEAIETTQKLYPGLLERNQNLLFLLKCRQFVEMVSGHDSEVRGPGAYSPSRSNKSSPCSSPTHPHSSSSGGNSLNSSPHSSNGFVSNGIQNGVGGDVETLMEIEEENEVEISRNGVLNGSASQEEITCSPRRGNGPVNCYIRLGG